MTTVIVNLNRIVPIVHSCVCRSGRNFQIRLLCNEITNNKLARKQNKINDELDALTYVRKDNMYRFSKKGTMNTLQQLLGIDKMSALEIAEKYKDLCHLSPDVITSNYEICKEHGLSKESVVSCPYILAQRDLPEKLYILAKLPDDINKMVGLLKLDITKLSTIVKQFSEEINRVIYYSELLNVPPLEICDQLIKKPFLIKLSLDKVSTSVAILKKYGIDGRQIFNDLWSLNYSTVTSVKRIEFAKANNLDSFKTWMIRAPPRVLQNYIKIRSESKLILGNNSLAEYLSNRLECSIEVANYLISKQPALKSKSVKKMDEIIDYLYEQGFKSVQICKTPKILLHSVDTMKKRIKELQEQGVHVDKLNLLTKTQKRYQIYYDTLVKNNMKKLQGIE